LGELTPRLAFDLSLYVVVGPDCAGARRPSDIAVAAVQGGATMVQLRFKRMDRSRLIEEGREIVRLLRPSGVPVIVNDDVEAAVEIEAQGAHVGQGDMAPEKARKLMGGEMILGLSITGSGQVDSVDEAIVDYLGVGPVFLTATKSDAAAPMGLDGMAAVCRSTRLPVAAIGGIDVENTAAVIRAGADGIAVVSAVCSAADPRVAAELLARAVEAGRRPEGASPTRT
jgi:thiamine-phosphate pyrophosphorylase